jgi:hypothetical protein
MRPPQSRSPIRVGPLTRRASGVIKMPKGGSAHGVLEDALLKRHGPEPMKIQKKRNLFDEIQSGIADMQAHRERKVNWAEKGASLSSVTAAKEYGIPHDDLIVAIKAGQLQYQVGSMHGNPWFRLLRREVEALFAKRHGASQLKGQKAKANIAKANREIRQLQKRIKLLQGQVAEWERGL